MTSQNSRSTVALITTALAEGNIVTVDLTAPLSSDTPVLQLPDDMAPIPPFAMEEVARFDERGMTSFQNAIHTGEHVGTHLDAPNHWITGDQEADVASIPVEHLLAPAVVIDRTAEVTANPDYLLDVQDLLDWQEEHGAFPEGGWLLFRTGWSSRLNNRDEYLNITETGPHTPGMTSACAEWLAQESPLVGIGVETVGTDAGQAFLMEPQFPCHHFMLGAGKYGLTQLQNLDQLPIRGSMLIVSPLKIVGGSGSPSRVFAVIDS